MNARNSKRVRTAEKVLREKDHDAFVNYENRSVSEQAASAPRARGVVSPARPPAPTPRVSHATAKARQQEGKASPPAPKRVRSPRSRDEREKNRRRENSRLRHIVRSVLRAAQHTRAVEGRNAARDRARVYTRTRRATAELQHENHGR